MAQFTWIFDAPTGTYKQHALSKRLYWAALEDAKFLDFTKPVEGYGKGMGENVTLMRIKTMAEPASPDLTEAERIPEDEHNINTVTVTPVEIGRSVPYTSFSEDLSFFGADGPAELKNDCEQH